MHNNHKILIVFLLLSYSFRAFAQTGDTTKGRFKEVKITQMTVMVMPRVNEDEDIRKALDQSDTKRLVVAKIKEAFDKRGFKTIDFVARFNAMKSNSAFRSANPKDAKAMLIESSGTDLVVEADVIIKPAGNLNNAKIPVQCYDAASGFTLGISVDGCSRSNQTTDLEALALSALNDNCLQNFLNSMNEGFAQIRENGRPVKLQISPAAGSTFNLFSKPKGATKNLSTLISDWLGDNTVKGNYVVNGSTKLLFDLDDVRIPLLDSKNKNYKPFAFGNDLSGFLESLGVKNDSEVKNGTVYITIN